MPLGYVGATSIVFARHQAVRRLPERQRERRYPANERDAEQNVQDADHTLVSDPPLTCDDRGREEDHEPNGA